MRLLILLALGAGLCFAQGGATNNCAARVPIAITIASTTGSIKIVTATGGPLMICQLSFNADTSGNIKLVTGTGTNCGTGAANLTGLYYNATGLAIGPFTIPASVDLCINFSATVNAGGLVMIANP